MTVGNTAGVQAALRLQGVELRRYGRTILTEVDLEVPRGGKWVLFGPNGIGKSSLVQMMATRAFPSRGTVDVLGRRLGKTNVFSYRHLIGLSSAELARAFPGVLAVNSSAKNIRDEIPDEPAIVVATPGAEPSAPSGYAGVMILDTEVTLGRVSHRAAEEAVRRWSNAAAMARRPVDGGSVLLVGSATHPAVQALLRADVAGFATRELADRADAGLTPAVKMARIVGDTEALPEFLDNDDWAGVDILGPTEVGPERWAALLRTPVDQARELTRRVKSAAAIRSARKERGQLSIHIDPESLEES